MWVLRRSQTVSRPHNESEELRKKGATSAEGMACVMQEWDGAGTLREAVCSHPPPQREASALGLSTPTGPPGSHWERPLITISLRSPRTHTLTHTHTHTHTSMLIYLWGPLFTDPYLYLECIITDISGVLSFSYFTKWGGLEHLAKLGLFEVALINNL